MDMYGEEENWLGQSEDLRKRFRGEIVPMHLLENQKYMEEVRKCVTLNLSMPGAIETEHPHRFLDSIF